MKSKWDQPIRTNMTLRPNVCNGSLTGGKRTLHVEHSTNTLDQMIFVGLVQRSSFSDFIGLRSVTAMALALTVVSASGSAASIANPTEADAWERRPSPNLYDCPSLDRSLIVPVPMAHRSEAIARLKNVALVKLTPPQLAALLGLRAGVALSGLNRLKKEIEQLKEQRREELENQRGSWSLYDQQRLNSLTKLVSDPTTSNLRPFLVRAVAKYEGTGAFSAYVCGGSLVVVHGSLGRSTPPSVRAPVIVFLKKRPSVVYVSWEMAE